MIMKLVLLHQLVLLVGPVASLIPPFDALQELGESVLTDLLLEPVGTTTRQLVDDVAPQDPDTHRSVKEIIESRGFIAEEHDVETKDGYILTVQRIVNPLIGQSYRAKMKPVIMQHGLMSSAADWVINSVNVKPAPYPAAASTQTNVIDKRDTAAAAADDDSSMYFYEKEQPDRNENIQLDSLSGDSQERPNSLGFYLANRGYDVWLANSRGNIYGQRHVNMSSWNLKFWDFTFDEQIEYDLPAVIEHVQRVTNKTKVAYVGHSQGTVMGFGLLSERPEYADIIEPFVALAPVAYCNHATSPVKYFAVYTPIWSHVNLWFATSNVAVKYLAPIVCGPKMIRKDLCANILFLSVGFDEDELDDSRVSAYLNHTPSGTSVKNVAHYGQEVLSGRFAKFDHGILGNMYKYGSHQSPSYDLGKIRSKSIAMFTAENDWLAAPKDVARLVSELQVPIYYRFNVTTVKPKWNHIDYVYGKDAGTLINTRIEKIMDAFRDDNDL